jgi:hypothetical protein
MQHNIYAMTETVYSGTYPDYVSINREDNKVTLSIRSQNGEDSAKISLTAKQVFELQEALDKYLKDCLRSGNFNF